MSCSTVHARSRENHRHSACVPRSVSAPVLPPIDSSCFPSYRRCPHPRLIHRDRFASRSSSFSRCYFCYYIVYLNICLNAQPPSLSPNGSLSACFCEFRGRYDGQVPHNGVDGSAGQSGSGNNSGGVSNTSGSIVTGYRERSGSMETPGGTSSQREVQRKILLGEYNLNTRLVGDKGGDFISKVGGWTGGWAYWMCRGKEGLQGGRKMLATSLHLSSLRGKPFSRYSVKF